MENSTTTTQDPYEQMDQNNEPADLLLNPGAGGGHYLDRRDESLAKIEILVLSIIFFLAVVGNGLMLFALRQQLKFRPMSRMYYFMLNLSLADLLVAFGNILPQLAWDITFRFRGNDLLCRAVKFLQIFVLYLSTYILTAMALDRYMVVCHQTFSRNHYSGIRGPKILITIAWIISICLASPQSIIFSYQLLENGIYDCWVHFSSPWDKVYVTWFVVWIFILPLLIIFGSYGAICIKVVRFNLPQPSSGGGGAANRRSTEQTIKLNGYVRGNKMKPLVSSSSEKTSEDGTIVITTTTTSASARSTTSGSGSSPSKTQDMKERQALKRQISRAKIKTVKLTLVIVICFFVCFAPFCMTQLIMVYNPPESGTNVDPLKVIILLLASLNSCTNPWIYLFFSESLCNQLRMCLRIGLLRGSNEESIGDEQVQPAPPKPKPIKQALPLRGSGDQQFHNHHHQQHKNEQHHRTNINIKIKDADTDENVPETKSEALPNTSKEKEYGNGG